MSKRNYLYLFQYEGAPMESIPVGTLFIPIPPGESEREYVMEVMGWKKWHTQYRWLRHSSDPDLRKYWRKKYGPKRGAW